MKKIKRTPKPTSAKISPPELPHNRLLILSLAGLTLVALLLLRNIFSKGSITTMQKKTIPEAVKKILGGANTDVTVANMKKTNGVYEFELSIGKGTTARKYTSYVTTDGKIIFTSGIKVTDLNAKNTQGAATTQQKKLTCNDLSKSDTPKLTAFIVSNCPFGLQMQRVFKKTIGEQAALGSLLDVKYIGSVDGDKIISMHGDAEAQENLKQICIREEQKDKFWPYLSCYMQEGKSDECSATAGVDAASLQACTTDKNRGLAYAKKDFDLSNKFQIGSSPTLLLNDKQIVSEFDFGGRVADSIKQVVCCGSKTKGDYCDTKLTTDEVATAFSATDAPAAAAGGSGSAAANCGTQ